MVSPLDFVFMFVRETNLHHIKENVVNIPHLGFICPKPYFSVFSE